MVESSYILLSCRRLEGISSSAGLRIELSIPEGLEAQGLTAWLCFNPVSRVSGTRGVRYMLPPHLRRARISRRPSTSNSVGGDENMACRKCRKCGRRIPPKVETAKLK